MTVMFQKNPRIKAYSGDFSWKIEPCDPWRPWFTDISDAWKSCLPLSIASQIGWVIRCPYRFKVAWTGESMNSGLLIESDSPKCQERVKSHFGNGILTFILPILFETNKPYGLLATGPLNTVKPGIHPLSGYVETDWSPYPFTMNWKMTSTAEWIKFEEGEPICMVMPFDARMLERTRVEELPLKAMPKKLKTQAQEWANIRALESAVNRDRLYLSGKCPITRLKVAKNHLLKLALKPFQRKQV